MTKKYLLVLMMSSMALLTTFSSCYYDNAEDLLGSTVCDTTSVSYANDIVPIISGSCFVCHGSGSYTSAGAGILLEGYDAMSASALSGALAGVIDHAPGYSAMPKSSPQLPACDRALVRNWAAQDALNN